MLAELFPGQGSQHVGMGADLLASDPGFRGWVEHASNQAGCDLARILRRGPESALRQTAVLQPLMVCVSLGYHQHLHRAGVRASLMAGHSLGELSALAAAGVLEPETAIHLAVCRGRAMQSAAAVVDGGMLAVTTDDPEAVLYLAAQLPEGPLALANENSPTQVVLSGQRNALEAVVEQITLARLGTCRRLPVSGPWHTPLMASARAEFAAAAATVTFRAPAVPWISNVTGRVETDPERVRRLLIECLTATVRWRVVMATCREAGVATLLEIGPGRVLSGLARANGFGLETACLPVNDLRSVQTAAQQPR